MSVFAVAAALQTVARRPSDLAARYGGEEFAVVLSGTSQERALAIAESIRRERRGSAHFTPSVSGQSVRDRQRWRRGRQSHRRRHAGALIFRQTRSTGPRPKGGIASRVLGRRVSSLSLT